jgi:hypothetical protein
MSGQLKVDLELLAILSDLRCLQISIGREKRVFIKFWCVVMEIMSGIGFRKTACGGMGRTPFDWVFVSPLFESKPRNALI